MMMKKKPKAGPSRNREHIRFFIDKAREAALIEIETPELLDRLRAGDQTARRELQDKLAYLIFEGRSGDLDPHDITDEFIRIKGFALATCVDRLAKNEVIGFTAVIKFFRDEIVREIRDRWREDSQHILAERSTNSMRKLNGQEPYRDIKRIDHTLPPPDHQYEHRTDGYQADNILHDPPHNEDEDTLSNLINNLTDDTFEADVLRMISLGYSYNQIATTLSTSKYAVENVVASVRNRHQKRTA